VNPNVLYVGELGPISDQDTAKDLLKTHSTGCLRASIRDDIVYNFQTLVLVPTVLDFYPKCFDVIVLIP
jgi:hypothetical protein